MAPTHVILGTAGHVDHGKTALVKALTGIDTDTQPEEQARGVTIDVGFAYWQDHVTVVDVPGHERFVKNAVTGASSIDLALFVVAADDGVMPQTREHLAILQLLGLRRGVVALTKTDLVEPDWVELVTEELRELFADTFLADAPILPVSSISGEGIEALRETLESEFAAVEPRSDRGAFRLPVDRVFSVSGFGTVVTGTVLAGTVRPRDELVLQPQGHAVRVRGVQVHGKDVTEAGVGLRAAINVSDLNMDDVDRGDTLACTGYFPATYMLDANLHMLDAIPAPLQHRDRVRLHLGPKEVLARVVLLDAETLGPEEQGFVQFRLETPAVAAHGDRLVVRRYSPARTIGGGIVLDPQPVKHRRRRPDVLAMLAELDNVDSGVEAFLRSAQAEGRTAQDVAHLLGADVGAMDAELRALVESGKASSFTDRGSTRYLHSDTWSALRADIVKALTTFHAKETLKTGMGREPLFQQATPRCPQQVYDALLVELEAAGQIRTQSSQIGLANHSVELSTELEDLRRRLGELLKSSAATPPNEAEMAQKLEASGSDVDAVIEVMQARGDVLRLADQLLFDASVLQGLQNQLIAYLQEHGMIEVSAFRELANTSRKFAVPLLNHFDSSGVTLRDGSVRRLLVDSNDEGHGN
jgi:selenocysteine-specific elongation factor